MYLKQFHAMIGSLFGELLIKFKDQGEYGFTNKTQRECKRISYSTNITPELIEQAYEKKIDLMITHHDAWNFIYGMKDECVRLLKAYDIAHFFIHLPLDYADFGTGQSLLNEIGQIQMIQGSYYFNGESRIGIGELLETITFNELVTRLKLRCNEEVKAWNFGTQSIQRIGILTGAGDGTKHVREALEAQCDVYITGEKTLYTIQYAEFSKINLIVGSHTFTEVFGVRSLANKVRESFPEIEIVHIEEKHME